MSDPALELLLLQAGSQARRERSRDLTLTELRSADPVHLAQTLAARRLLALIGSRLVAVGGDACPEAFRASVTRARTSARVRGMALDARAAEVGRMLVEAGVPVLPLKGTFLAEAAHGDLGLRETNDIDLLVPRSELRRAADLLVRAGFRTPADRLRPDGLPDLHLSMVQPGFPPVELHWRIHWNEETFSEGMLARAVPGPDGLARPRHEDLAASLLLFYARDGLQGVRLPADYAAWWDRHGHELEPGFLRPVARLHPELDPALTAAAAVTEGITGVPALAALGPAAASRRVALAIRLADWAQREDHDQLAANVSLTNGLLARPGAVREHLRRELTPRSGGVAPHATKIVLRSLYALWRVRGGRRWLPPAVAP